MRLIFRKNCETTVLLTANQNTKLRGLGVSDKNLSIKNIQTFVIVYLINPIYLEYEEKRCQLNESPEVEQKAVKAKAR